MPSCCSIVCQLYHLSVIGQLDVSRQRGVDFSMSPNVVAGVDEPGLASSDALSKGYSLVECLVGVVWLLT